MKTMEHMDGEPIQPGTSEHAIALTEGRHPGIRDGLQWLTYSHLPPALQRFSKLFYEAAVALVQAVPTDSPELTTAINRLIAAKDSAVRAGIRNDTGRAGSVPRPQAVVDPPKLASKEITEERCMRCSRDRGIPHASWCPTQG